MSKRSGVIALIGRPNAGKSTLLNQILGEKIAIVSDKPQTTRNRILGVYHGEGVQIGFLDLPGIHKAKFKMNQRMLALAYDALNDVDLAYHIIDVMAPLGKGDTFVHEMLAEKKVPVVTVANKVDLINQNRLIGILDEIYTTFAPTELVPVSAKSGANLDRLLKVTEGFLPEGDFLFGEDELTDQPIRFIAQEFIREKILHLTREEIPHAAAVTIDAYEEEEDEHDGVFIAARIWVERPSQRRIILGAGGKMIKKIRESARRSLKKLLEKPVTIELNVKVAKNWRNMDRFLSDLRIDGKH